MTRESLVKRATTGSAANWTTTVTTSPKKALKVIADQSVCRLRSVCPAPAFWEAIALTELSMADGTRKRKLISFSTIPTAAASTTPRWLTMTVIRRNDTCTKASCRQMGRPVETMARMVLPSILKSEALTGSSPIFRIAPNASRKLSAWLMTVARAAPFAPKPSDPMKYQSSRMLATPAIAMKRSGVLLSPCPRKMATTTL